ncbi:MAG: N-acetylmuramoyl-L-alanine amidase, partial [Bacteroidota bacterium]
MRRVCAFLLGLSLVAPAFAAPVRPTGQVRLFGYDSRRGAIVAYLNQAVNWKTLQLAHRDRFVVDLPGMVYLGSTSQLTAIPGTDVQSVRIGQFEPDIVRIVLDLKNPAVFPVDLEKTEKGLCRILIRTKAGQPTARPEENKEKKLENKENKDNKESRKPVRVAKSPEIRKPRKKHPPAESLVLRRRGKGWQMILAADDEISFRLGKLSGSDRLYLDVTGGTIDLPHDSVYVDNGIIARVRVGKQDSDTTRLVMDLDQPVKHSVRLSGDRRAIIIGLSPDEKEAERITLDPGHGGQDDGARGRRLREKELNLQVALRVQRMMEEAGLNVQLTRSKDVAVMLRPRVAKGNNNNSDVFVSIHANSCLDPSTSGIETYYFTPQSLPL